MQLQQSDGVEEADLQLSELSTWATTSMSTNNSTTTDHPLLENIQVIHNRNPCISHLLLLSVKAALKEFCVQTSLKDVRRTFLYF